MVEQKLKAKSRSPGRPARTDILGKASDLRDSILDHAELVFAEAGYEGANLREIASRAGVNQALIRYYFGSKADLFEECFRRRGGLLAGHRHVNLDRLLEISENPSVEDLVYAYLKPQWDMKYSSPNGAAFVAMQARLHAEPEEHALRLRREVYDASVKRYISAISHVLPQVPRDIISVRMAFLVGAYLFMLNDLGRIGDLTEGHLTSFGKNEMLDQLVRFLAAGLRAPV
ncbi:TetR family transcriptional regulator [Rhizobium leguminosarum bv. trifolii]|uniref:TetR family transcriptional regulator n=1 Tax=Rhizobium leguminosarum bv. trifolii TaxID=386 RepID=A0A3E1BAW9_RHILT|nr:TetR/AcrR family transcriptional regulator [Rhizobium leguminosarum]RFB85101.1 TetR family transcriptional regulator [Rhizobium leguminosarum bv. trifolii]RFB86166.1 TetR family transcriptional regulator [Rhizobium leguminosarum bv. trifolii]RFB88695.1 TetR family transcriptional regulator [Rhizobium leguminosarum bv. trifolii]